MDSDPLAIPGVRALCKRFDAYLVDVWGVLHDGGSAYPGAVDCLERLARQGRRVVILSNAARRTDRIAAELAEHGIGPDLYCHIVSSGELVWRRLRAADNDYGRHCYYLGPARSRSLLAGLDLDLVENLERADFILNAGAEGDVPDATGYRDLLAHAAAAGVPMLCANPDRVAIRRGVMGISAGAIAEAYTALGGRVESLGKPQSAIYAEARKLPGMKSASLLAVGDGIQTDILGGHEAGLSTLLITGGIHGEELRSLSGSMAALCALYGIAPDYFCERFAW
jgi:HAD superfamily hydrolase (TIGR01459 family)